MNWLDRALQRRRIDRARRWIRSGGRVLDIGCYDDSLFRALGPNLGYGVGLDPLLEHPVSTQRFRMERGSFPDVLPTDGPFDVITMLAVLEHVDESSIDKWAVACRELLAPGGIIVATIPHPAVDTILGLLLRMKMLHGMEVGQHHGMPPRAAVASFVRANFAVVASKRFELGLNNLVVLAPR